MRIANTNQTVNMATWDHNYAYAFAKFKCIRCGWYGEEANVGSGRNHGSGTTNRYECPNCNNHISPPETKNE